MNLEKEIEQAEIELARLKEYPYSNRRTIEKYERRLLSLKARVQRDKAKKLAINTGEVLISKVKKFASNTGVISKVKKIEVPKLKFPLRAVGAAIVFSTFTIYGLAGISNIEPGEVGVVIKNVGDGRGMQEYTFDTGMHWVEPFIYDVVVYDTRLKQYSLEDVPSNTKDGQPIQVDISFEIGLLDNNVPNLHENIGRDYFDQVVYPAARSALRGNTSKLLSDEIYTGSGRAAVQLAITEELQHKLEPLGIRVVANLRDIEFLNPDFVRTLERKAQAAQEQIIEERLAEAAVQAAIKVKNKAEGEKFKTIQEAEAQRERLRLEGEGQRLQKEEEAKGILAIAQAEAEGIRLKQQALSGPGGKLLRDIEVLGGLGKNVDYYGVPTGAPGTNTYIIDEALKGKVAVGQ